jgi:hypothetical protein
MAHDKERQLLDRALSEINSIKGRKPAANDALRSVERRNFFEISAKFGFTAAVVAAGAGTLFSREAAAQTAQEEQEREKSAKNKITLATEYRVGTTRSYPVIQLNVKENLQNFTNGKIYVKLQAGGALGIGTALAQKVQAGTVEIGQFSLSNFAPFAPAVDLINLPYWCGENQKFVNLVTSDVWENQVNKLVREKGFEPMFYFCIDPRTAAKRRGLAGGPFKTPKDLEGIKFRVPGSEILPPARRQPDAGGMGRNSLGPQAGCCRRARSGPWRTLCVRLQGYPLPRHLQSASAGQPSLRDEQRLVRRPRQGNAAGDPGCSGCLLAAESVTGARFARLRHG